MLGGCGPARVPTAPVSGQVIFADGQSVRTGTVELESLEHGTTATGTIRHDGTFVLGTYTSDDGAALGKHRAIVVQIIVADGLVQHSLDHGRPVPPRYGSYDTSGLEFTVEPIETNQMVLTLDVPVKP